MKYDCSSQGPDLESPVVVDAELKGCFTLGSDSWLHFIIRVSKSKLLVKPKLESTLNKVT